jgi:hypothetical protein
METGVLNFFFKECKALMADGLMMLLVKSEQEFNSPRKGNLMSYIKVMDYVKVRKLD